MSYKRTFLKRQLLIKWKRDPYFKSIWFNKLLNKLMKQGKRLSLEKKFQQVVLRFKWNFKQLFYKPLLTKIFKFCPAILVQPKWKGKEVFYVPTMASYARKQKIVLKWFSNGLNKREEIKYKNRLYGLICSSIFDRRSHLQTTHKEMAKLIRGSRASLHFRWH